MAQIKFHKYQATGNDFIIINSEDIPEHIDYSQLAQKLCPRRISVGADGLIIIIKDPKPMLDFEMQYFNVDGSGPIMCGNGARASVQYFHQNLAKKNTYGFLAPDGKHQGKIKNEIVEITMGKAQSIQKIALPEKQGYLLNTGAPHLVWFKKLSEEENINRIARPLRAEYNANVNFISRETKKTWRIRTYERGVEEETLACGTGVTAAALVIDKTKAGSFPYHFRARGGRLSVNCDANQIWLAGPAIHIYSGNINL
jgi:diaminopimelate epimerase